MSGCYDNVAQLVITGSIIGGNFMGQAEVQEKGNSGVSTVQGQNIY